ncbi:MAG: RES family NAD+ phosphorylase [Terriglobia bacterium]|nr:RES family NAD+ phosphorylase [Terriglobia bacterium]
MEAWRITRARKSADAFSGDGARLFGGRWNSPGIPMVYTAGSRSLAILEVLAHLTKSALLNHYVLYRLGCDDSLVQILSDLPAGWNLEPPTQASQSVGDAWIESGTHPVLSVPSAIVPEERNYLLNPAHPEFSRIVIARPATYRIDPRLL